jgi:allophanate hydrolase subunit 1
METPGGWNLIGRTPRLLFDPQRAGDEGNSEAAFLLRAGDRVQFVAST